MSERYQRLEDGETQHVPMRRRAQIMCCDCGLVHDYVFWMKDGKLFTREWRNERATSAARRHQPKRRAR